MVPGPERAQAGPGGLEGRERAGTITPGTRNPNRAPMQHLSIARSLRLALVALTLALAVVAALGVASLYNSRQSYENKLEQTSSLATAGANLASAGIAEEEVLRDARGPQGATARRNVATDYQAAAATASKLAEDDPASKALVRSSDRRRGPGPQPGHERAAAGRDRRQRSARARTVARHPTPSAAKCARRRRPASRPATTRAGRSS